MAKKNRNLTSTLPNDAGDPRAPGPIKLAAGPVKLAAVRPQPGKRPVEADSLGFLDDSVALGLGLLCTVLPRIVEPGIRDLFQLPKQLLMADAAAWFLALLAALSFMNRPIKLPKTPLIWPGLALIASVLISVALAPQYTGGILSIFAKYDLHRWSAAAVLFGVTLVGISSPRRLWYVAGGLLLGGLWVAFIGIGEQHNIAALLPTERWAIISKPGSTFGNRNMAAELIVAVMPVCYALLALSLRWWLHGRRNHAVVLGGVGAASLVVLTYYLKLTVTRAAWAGVLIGLLGAATAWLLGLWIARRKQAKEEGAPPPRGLLDAPFAKILAPLAMGLVVVTTVALVAPLVMPASEEVDSGDAKRNQSVLALMKSFFESSKAYEWRTGMWTSSWEAMKANPEGGGAGNWRVIYPKYVTQREKNDMFNIAKQPIRGHQDFLQFGVEYGFLGLFALLTLIGMAFWLTVRAVAAAAAPAPGREDGASWLAFAAMASLAAIAAICGDALGSFPLQLPAPTFLFALHLGIIGAAESWLTGRGAQEAAAPLPDAGRWGLTAAAVIALVYLLGFGSYQGLHERWMIAERGFTDGRGLQKRGNPGQGLAAIRQAIQYNPDDFQNHFIEALNLNSMGKTKEAIASIEKSLQLYPNLLNAWVNLAMFNRRLGNDAKMNEAIDAALKLKPDELVAINTKVQWLLEHDKYEAVLLMLRPQIGAFKSPDGKGAVPKGRVPYAEYRKSGNWPNDDGGQLLGSYKQSLKHAAAAAKKLEKWDEAAVYFKLIDDEGLPNEGSEARKRKDWMSMAVDVAESYSKAGNWQAAFPYYKRAAELAENTRPDLKRQFAIAAARVGDWKLAGHEAGVTLRIDAGERDKLVEALQALKKDRPQDAAQVDAALQEIKQ